MIYITYYEAPIDILILTSDGIYLTGLWYKHRMIVDDQYEINDNLNIFIICKYWLDQYFKGNKMDGNIIPIKMKGTPFQKIVWLELMKIHYGCVITYGELAKRVAKILGKEKMSPQAIGQALTRNPISIIVPCHRIVGKNNLLTGYAGGIEIKEYLLKLEGCIKELQKK